MLSIFASLRDVTLLSVAVRMLLAVLCGGAIGIASGSISAVRRASEPISSSAWARP